MPNLRKKRDPARRRRLNAIKKIRKERIPAFEAEKKRLQQIQNSTRVYSSSEAREYDVDIAEQENKIKRHKKAIERIKKAHKEDARKKYRAGKEKKAPRERRAAITERQLNPRSRIRDLLPRAKPWAEYIVKDRASMAELMNYEQKIALKKMAEGKRVTRADMDLVIDAVREFRSVFPQRMPPELRKKK